jgi:hypothetical protein
VNGEEGEIKVKAADLLLISNSHPTRVEDNLANGKRPCHSFFMQNISKYFFFTLPYMRGRTIMKT